MSRTLNLRAPASMKLGALKPAEVERYVSKLADDHLARVPDGLRASGINAAVLSQLTPGTNLEPGVWVEWTRACCNRRDQIEDFVDPVIDQFEREGSPVLRELGGQHLESQMRVQTLEHPTQHKKA
jgi:hypothetical protein